MSDNAPTWNPASDLSEEQRERLDAYEQLLVETNQHVNLISRSDEEHVHLHHIHHSLSLSYRPLPEGSSVVDWGTGGGLPGIPLAIRFPNRSFDLVDSTRKKILAVRRMIRQLDLDNVEAWHGRAEDWPGETDYAVSRATAPLRSLWQWYDHVRSSRPVQSKDEDWPPGLLTLKGGELSPEIESLKSEYPDTEIDLIPLQPVLGHAFFARKAIVFVHD